MNSLISSKTHKAVPGTKKDTWIFSPRVSEVDKCAIKWCQTPIFVSDSR